MTGRIKAHLDDVRSLAFGAVLGLAAPPLLVLFLLSGPLSLVGGLGLLLLAGVILAARGLADVQHRRFGTTRWRTVDIYVEPPRFGFAWLRTAVKDPQTWRDLAWVLAQFPLGVGSLVVVVGGWLSAIQFVAAPMLLVLLPKPTSFDPAVLELTGRSGPLTWVLVPVGIGLVLVLPWVARRLVGWQGLLAVSLLERRRQNLEARLAWVTTSRTSAVDASAAELQRIERDLHDGAQARLVSVSMSLGMAEHVIDTNVDSAKVLLAEARADTATALTELRNLVRGIHPPVLADRGLGAAIEALRLTSRLPVDLDLRLERRLKLAVESAAYFVIAESLVNALKHSGAQRIGIRVVDLGERLAIDVSDDGCGGADPARGTGLQGIQRRLSAFDGSLSVSSPLGGPTVLTMELSCGS
ncbi:sensor domain-containing protein [Dactylosporangium vinaceum]|uniref:histidine kinase n=1 Tax=Dactylosporangium vinaceum TaxID=53362 RepID=A0ABV5LYD1_9ACTN|nr:sensor histidine kinase [Dactylosporangium vinaceum]UAB95826.1 sensor domain-containing protein [Dactylosporangium vinaceum]